VPLPLTIPLILASQSPRRRELLATAGILFTVRVREVEEIRAPGEPPDDYARRLARAKAEAAWEDRNEIVLGADTVVVLDQQVLEKPRDQADARAMLRLLSGREHTVITGICLRHPGGSHIDSTATSVRFTAQVTLGSRKSGLHGPLGGSMWFSHGTSVQGTIPVSPLTGN
jgi:septum formation protein